MKRLAGEQVVIFWFLVVNEQFISGNPLIGLKLIIRGLEAEPEWLSTVDQTQSHQGRIK